MNIDKVVTLVNKLLALSKDGGATEHEAALAAEKAQELMTEHNLSMATVEAAGGDSGDSGVRVKDGLDHRQVYNWQKQLMAHIAELNFCHCMLRYETRSSSSYPYTTSKVFNGYQLIGRAANVASTRIMFEYLLQSISRLAKDHLDPKEFFTRFGHSFKEGCADRVVERLQDRREKELKQQEAEAREQNVRSQHPAAATGNVLVVVLREFVQDEKDLNNDMVKGLPPGTTKRKREEDEARSAAWVAERAAKEAALRAEWLARDPNIDPDRLWYLARGYSSEFVDDLMNPKPAKPETEIQKQKRLVKERNDQTRDWARQNRENRRLDYRGYQAGVQAGDQIGLDRQMDEDKKHRLT